MGYPWGKAPQTDGTGTTPTDLQRVIGAQFHAPGILPDGGLTVEGTSSMAYKVNPGAAFLWTDATARLGVLIPVEGTVVNTTPAPATGSRTDSVYVTKDGEVGVVAGTTIPAGGVSVARFTVPAGITATSAAQMSLDRNFAIPVGATLGRLGFYRHPSSSAAPMVETTLYSGRFFLPSDRMVRVDMNATIRSVGSTPGIANFSVEFGNGGSKRTMMCAHTSAWNTFSASWSFIASEGANTFSFLTRPHSGAGWNYTTTNEVATEFTIWDAGVAR